MARSTIPVSPEIRDRIKSYGSIGDPYNSILARILDQIELDRFVEQLRREADDPNTEWVDLKDLGWGESE